MTKDEALRKALEALKKLMAYPETIEYWKQQEAITAIEKALAQQTDEFKCPLCYDDIANIKNPSQPEQEPVGGSMTTPEPPPECQTEAEKKAFAFGWWKAMEAQREDKSQEFPKRFDTHPSPPQRKPLTDEQILSVARDHYNPHQRPEISFARAVEAAHDIKE